MTTGSEALTPEAAAKFLNDETTWPPGWSVTAQADGYPRYGSNNVSSPLFVTLVRKGKNSSLPSPDGTYSEPWELQFPLGVPGSAMQSRDALMFWVLEKMTWCDEHENREFCRYRLEDGTWYAPFHPHRGYYYDQSKTPEWQEQAKNRDPGDLFIAGRR